MKWPFFILISILVASCGGETDVDNSAENISKEALVFAVMGRYRDNQDPFGRGVQMVANEVNVAGGIGGRPIELVFRKSDCSSTIAKFEAENLLQQYPNLIGVTGPECSGAGASVSAVMGAENIPIVAYTTSSPSLSVADTFYRLQASDLAIIGGFVQSMLLEKDRDNDGRLSLSIIYGDDPFNAGLGQGIVDGFRQAGGEIISEVPYPDGTLVDFTEYLQTMFAPNGEMVYPDIIAIMGFEKEIANITLQIPQIAENMPNFPVYTSGLDQTVLTDGSPDIVKNAVTLTPNGAFSPIVFPYLDSFLNEFNRIWQTEETAEDSAQGYDAMMLHVLALLQAHELGQIDVTTSSVADIRQGILDNLTDVSRGVNDFEKEGDQPNTAYIKPFEFAKALAALKAGHDINYNGASGYIDFDKLGDINYGAFFLQVPVRSGESFTVKNLSLNCFGPPECTL
ncbi:ABC transporter substrate-binding protein [Paraglaciecola aquimarina]|uniref:ABC transporter substrate-binding protein n=1 Tax=Paraglaciecola algarum TaxID=3050085 RepID=A0ABS9D952_9ALTE|nr:ABC transporter substrate-binding protein [Paraglaciecola sp. G1-23]MCF2949497.1 ABC transporter substrate-binding protein [Paraglaciecola sp. G1-23]